VCGEEATLELRRIMTRRLPQPRACGGKGSWIIGAGHEFGSKCPNIGGEWPLFWGRALGRAVRRVDRLWNKHAVVGIPPPPSRRLIHPTLSLPLLYLPPNNPNLLLTRCLLLVRLTLSFYLQPFHSTPIPLTTPHGCRSHPQEWGHRDSKRSLLSFHPLSTYS